MSDLPLHFTLMGGEGRARKEKNENGERSKHFSHFLFYFCGGAVGDLQFFTAEFGTMIGELSDFAFEFHFIHENNNPSIH
jgi:hypothetical protein